MGVVLEDSNHAKEMDNACTDDVAAARLLIDRKGVKSQAPGVTSSLFWNNSCNAGKVPVLKTVLNVNSWQAAHYQRQFNFKT